MVNLSGFLVRAKKSTYASGEKAKKLDDGFEEFVFEEGNLRYRDRYRAKDPRPFGGEEVVWENGVAIWMMNYYGFIVKEGVDHEMVYGFLKRAMSQVDEGRPFRGPSNFSEGDFEYVDESEGNVDGFSGTEKILFEGEEVYRLYYHGGRI